jgi:hypothetical protein
MTLRVELSWPEPDLWQNSRVHPQALASAVKFARHEAKIETLRVLDAQPYAWNGKPVTSAITGHKPNDRRRDLPNLQAALKGACDGIADALLVDDSNFVVTTEWGEMRPPRGGVTVEISQ